MTTIATRVQRVIADQLGVDLDRVAPDARIVEDLGGDSLDLVELIMALEVEFGVEIPDEQMETVQTAADAERVIAALTSAAAEGATG